MAHDVKSRVEHQIVSDTEEVRKQEDGPFGELVPVATELRGPFSSRQLPVRDKHTHSQGFTKLTFQSLSNIQQDGYIRFTD